MSANAIVDTSNALKQRLEASLASLSGPPTVYVGPLDDAGASGSALFLFLYRLVPNPNLRNREHTVVAPSPPPPQPRPVIVFRNSLPLDLYYLVTVGSSSAYSEETLLNALGLAMQGIQSDPDLIIRDQTVHVTPEPLSTEEASRIWNLFPTANYRTSIAYLATPVWIDPVEEPPLGHPVVEDRVLAGSKIGGIAP